MDDPRDTYELPRRPGLVTKTWWVMLAVPAIALLLWLVLPDSPVLVAVLVVVSLAAVFLGVGGAMRDRDLDKKPGRHPVPPPSME